jgi:hypothetical protein
VWSSASSLFSSRAGDEGALDFFLFFFLAGRIDELRMKSQLTRQPDWSMVVVGRTLQRREIIEFATDTDWSF